MKSPNKYCLKSFSSRGWEGGGGVEKLEHSQVTRNKHFFFFRLKYYIICHAILSELKLYPETCSVWIRPDFNLPLPMSTPYFLIFYYGEIQDNHVTINKVQ